MTKPRNYRCLEQQEFVSGRFSLRTIKDDDIEDIRRWRNDQMDVLRQSEQITAEQQKAYFNQKIWPSMELAQPENILLTFFEGDKRIGYGGLVHIAWEHRRAEVSFLLDVVYVHDLDTYTQYFSKYLSLIKKLAFSALKFNRLYTETYEFRHDHINVLALNGFHLEGRLRGHVLINEEYFDSLIHGANNEK